MSTQIERVQLLIDRGSDIKTPTIVFDFEVPILQDMHEGAGSGVFEQKRWPIQTDMTAQDAHALVSGKYGQKESADFVRAHYPNASTLARKTGLPLAEGGDVGPAQALVSTPNPEEKAAQDAEKAKREAAEREAMKSAGVDTGVHPELDIASDPAGYQGGHGIDPAQQQDQGTQGAAVGDQGSQQDQGGGLGGGNDGQPVGQ